MRENGDVPFWGWYAVKPQGPGVTRGKGTPPMLKLITETTAGADEATAVTATLDELARVGAQRMIAAALQIEVDDYLARYRDERDAAGHAGVVRNGTARARPVLTGVGPLTRSEERRVGKECRL